MPGIVTQVTLIPELNLGVIVLTNQQVGSAFVGITNTILSAYTGKQKIDWITLLKKDYDNALKEADEVVGKVEKEIEQKRKNNKVKPELAPYAGHYKDNWFGEISIINNNGRLIFSSKRSPKLKGELFHYTANTFIVKWFDRSLDADAFVIYSLDEKGEAVNIKMKAISPLADFSYDFHDLDLIKIK